MRDAVPEALVVSDPSAPDVVSHQGYAAKGAPATVCVIGGGKTAFEGLTAGMGQ